MKTYFQHSSFNITIILFLSICILRLSNPNWGKNGHFGVLSWDTFGYYLYLPATFIYDDPVLKNNAWVKQLIEKYDVSTTFYQAHALPNGNHVIQYTMGMALIYSPAFFLAHLIAESVPIFEPDGLSLPYQLAILIEALFILLFGLMYFRKLLLEFFQESIVTAIIIIIGFGSNFFVLAFTNTVTPHLILFSLYSTLLYFLIRWHKTYSKKYIYYSIIPLGLLILCRPNEISILIILFFGFSKNSPEIKSLFLKYKEQFLPLIVLSFSLLAIGSLQFYYWKACTGAWFFDTYIYEDFKFLHPHLKEFLISYKKGWFLYSPIMLLYLFGLWTLLKTRTNYWISLSLFSLIYIWILSSWDNWWYADSFGQRSIIQAYPVFALIIGFGLKNSWDYKPHKTVFILFSTACIVLNLFQSYQYHIRVIHPQRMTKSYYWDKFFATSYEEKNLSLLEPNLNLEQLPVEYLYQNRSLVKLTEINEQLSSERPWTPKNTISAESFYNNCIFLEGRIEYTISNAVSTPRLGIVFILVDAYSELNYKYSYQFTQLNNSSSQDIQCFDAAIGLPLIRSKNDQIETYVWLDGQAEVTINSFQVNSYEVNL